jgi:hypothetical protein
MMVTAAREAFQRVVPAKAGTHAVSFRFGTEADAFCPYQRQGLWAPAFAGTTQ